MTRTKPIRKISAGKRAGNRLLAKIRADVMEAHGWECAAKVWHCCSGAPMHLHHVKPRSRGGTNDIGNLKPVCFECHEYIHRHPAWAKRNGFTL